MGITFSAIERMDRLGLFGKGQTSILDIGSSNLYSANPEQVEQFLKKYSSADIPDTRHFAETLAKGSGYDPVRGGLNESFVGQLFEKAGMEYLAFDIADGYRTQILDLNHAMLPRNLRGHFDLVLNFGTTEHILNQYNCFKVIHDATKIGGYIHHSLLGTGYADHGYITYTCRCFFDIAGYNEYEIVDFWFEGPGGRNDLLQGIRNYSGYFPILKQVLHQLENSPQGSAIQAGAPHDVGFNIVCRKVKDKPFWGTLEASTSAGAIPDAVTANYANKHISTEDLPEQETPAVGDTKSRTIAQRISRSLRAFPLVHATAKRLYTTSFGKPAATPSSRLSAELSLTSEEARQRDRLISGDISFDEALQFYSGIVASYGSFPYPWEERILRLGIAKHPDRTDLVELLNVVLGLQGKQASSMTAPSSEAETVLPDSASISLRQKATDLGSVGMLKIRIGVLGSRSLVGLTDPAKLVAEYSEVACEAIAILSNPAFEKLHLPAQIEALVSFYNTAMSALLRESIALADLMSGHFVRLLNERNMTLHNAMHLYDCLYGLYFAGARNIDEMGRFDTGCVLPFESYLKTKYSLLLSPARTAKLDKTAENLCYFCHCAHFEKGNAVSPIMASLAKSHARRDKRKIYLYCVQWVSQDFVDSFAGSGVVVRQFKQDWRYDKLDAITAQLKADAIDVVITDLNSSIATVLFARRVAPLQMWIVMAYPYWSHSSLDWAMLPVLDYRPGYGIESDRVSALKIKQETETLIQECDAAAVSKVRSSLPENVFIFAVFSRLIKVTQEFLELIMVILREEPRAHVLLVGTGDPRTVYELAADALRTKRITFIHGNVDLNVYGRVVDVMLDTFPFHGGNACREVAIHGKPVLSLRDVEWGQFLDDERDAAVLAKDVDEYVAVALQLVRDTDFYSARSTAARQTALRVTHTGDMISEVEQAIAKARIKRDPAGKKSQQLEYSANPLSRLDQLIARNVAGKNGGALLYPGQPDPMAQQFTQFANEVFGDNAPGVVENTESLILAYLLNLYRQSGDTTVRHLSIDENVRSRLLDIYQSNQSVASPLFLATRYLIADRYSGVSIEEPALELGMGSGDTAHAILGDQKLAVGSTPILDEILGARHHFGNHRRYLAVDAAQIPYADNTFSSIVMNYTFYHLEDPARTCREMLRVLAPGGRLYFNFAIRNRIEATRVLLKLIGDLGLHDYGRMASSFVFTDYGSADDTPTKEGCLALLEKCGFINIDAVDYLSPDLSRLIWLTRDLEVLFQRNLHKAMGKQSVESVYRQFVETQLAALMSHDTSLCISGEGGTFMFVSAQKPGDQSRHRNLSDDEIEQRMVCPISHTLLQHRPGHLWSEGAKVAYPIYQDIALLIPIYGELWRRQNAQSGSDPASWAPFSY